MSHSTWEEELRDWELRINQEKFKVDVDRVARAQPLKPTTTTLTLSSKSPKAGANFEKEALLWKEKGNKALAEKKFVDAIDFYSQGLSRNSTLASILLANRSLAYLKLKNWQVIDFDIQEALEDADRSLKLDSSYTKALARKATALNELKQFSASLDAWYCCL
jgi:tetratricopeptide (TPR) repeat protein